jgi:hypothetical protein
MFQNFEKVVKIFLAIPVTPGKCYQGKCDGKPVHPYGAHAYHNSGITVHRHHNVRDLTVRDFRKAQRTAGSTMDVHVEPVLKEHGVRQKPGAPDTTDARADIMLFLPSHGWQYWLDVTLTHPKPYGPGIEADIEAAEKRKYDRYLNNFELSKSQVIPLVFTFMGGWSKQTEEFMRLIFMKMAQGKEEVFNKMYTRFRYQVSMVIAKSLGAMLNRQTWSNYVPGDDTDVDDMLAQMPSEAADPVDYDEPQEEDEGDSLSEDDEKSSSPESDTSSVESEDSLSSEEVELPQRALQSGRARQSKSSRRNVVVSRPILSKYNLRSMRRRHQHGHE